MSYAKNVWYDNESGSTPITADKLNHIEQGVFDNAAAWDSVSRTALVTLSHGVTYSKSGGTCTVAMSGISLRAGTLEKLGTLPAGFRPLLYITAPIIVSGGDTDVWSGTVGRLSVNESGLVSAYCENGAQSFFGSVSFTCS